MSNSVSPVEQVEEDAEIAEVILPSLEGYSSLLIKNNFWSIFNLGTKYYISNLGQHELLDETNNEPSEFILKGKQSLSFFGFRPNKIFLYDHLDNLVFQINILASSSMCFPALRGVRVADNQGGSIGCIRKTVSNCGCNNYTLKDYVGKTNYDIISKFNFCEGPDFIVKDGGSQTIAHIGRKGHQYGIEFTNSEIYSSTKTLIISFCLFTEVRGNLRLSNGCCLKP